MGRKINKLVALAAVAGGAALAVGATKAASALAALDLRLYRTRFGIAKVFTWQTPAGRPMRVLSLGGGWQTVMYLDSPDEPAAAYARAFDVVLDPAVVGTTSPRVAVIGGAGCAWPRHAVAIHPTVQVQVAEIDPLVVYIAMREFYLEDAIEAAGSTPDGRRRLQVIAADGVEFLKDQLMRAQADASAAPAGKHFSSDYVAGATGQFDAIIDDAFVGREANDVLVSPAGLELIKANLVPGGVFVLNVSVPTTDPSKLLAARAKVEAAFAHVYVVSAIEPELAEEENYLVIASDRELELAGTLEL